MVKTIPLTQGKVAVIDDRDYRRLSKYKWCALKHHGGRLWYAVRSKKVKGKTQLIYMHREVFGISKRSEVDHIDGDGLNNQRSNLRTQILGDMLQTINARKCRTHCGRPPTSRFKGISWSKERKKWRAAITAFRVTISLGSFDNEEDAARAYDKAARDLWGHFARTNF